MESNAKEKEKSLKELDETIEWLRKIFGDKETVKILQAVAKGCLQRRW